MCFENKPSAPIPYMCTKYSPPLTPETKTTKQLYANTKKKNSFQRWSEKAAKHP